MNHTILYVFLTFTLLIACNDGTGDQAGVADSGKKEKKVTEPDTPAKRQNILFFGNSLTAAYGLDPSEGYVSLIQQRLDSLELPYKAINAGLSGETTAGGKERVSWVLRQPVDIFVLELGGNDALRGISPEASKENLEAIILSVKNKYPDAKIVLSGMEAPPNMGEQYTSAFRKMYPELAEKHNTALIPFFLDGVAGIPELNQGDRIHPNEKGQFVLVENVWEVLEGLL
ncbi:MAG: arylesterase [Bacteroidota bacterium]